MLKLFTIKNPSARWKLLNRFCPETDQFIVSDLKTKQALTEKLLLKQKPLPEFCVMRADEFYKQLFYSLKRPWRLSSDSFVKELLAEFCANQKETWIKNLQNSDHVFHFFTVFLPVFFHQESESLLEEWFYKRKKSVIWQPLVKLCQSFFWTLESEKILPESGVKACLFHYLPLQDLMPFKKKRLFLDLSFSFDFCEKEIFKELSRYQDICVLSPVLDNQLFFKQDFNVYQALKKEIPSNDIISCNSFEGTPKVDQKQQSLMPKFFQTRSETQLEEVKQTVIQIKTWIKKGVSLKDIVIFAPNMEEYWPALKIYFKQENIPVNKSVFAKVIDFPHVKYFLSALRLHLGYVTFEDLEIFSFYTNSQGDFSQFKVCYSSVPDRYLVKRLLFNDKRLSSYEKITKSQFEKWAMFFWPEKESSQKDTVSRVFLKLPNKAQLKAEAWLRWFESELLALELEVEKENPQGLQVLSFNALYSTTRSYVFIMGLNEESLKSSSLNSVFTESERKSLLNDLGFPLLFSHTQEKENNLLWFLQSSHNKEVYLSFSVYDFQGDIKTPGLLYSLSEVLFSARLVHLKGKPLWNKQREQANSDAILNQSHLDISTIEALKVSLKCKDSVRFIHKADIRLSPQRLKTYRDCPFKYAAEKLFFVEDRPPVERELSALSKGSIVHYLFKYVLQRYPELNLSQKQEADIIELMKPCAEELIYKRQWNIVKEELSDLLQAFLAHEISIREQFPFLKPKDFEVRYEIYWNQTQGCFSAEKGYPFTAQVDRVDRDEATKTYVVRDYKASKGDLTHISSWVKPDKEEFQLTFYAEALRKGLIPEFPAQPVSALFYSFYKDNFSTKGFVEKNHPIETLMGKGLRGHKQDQKFLDQAIEKSLKQTRDLVKLMEEGHFIPKPRNKKLCKKCVYRTWCRVEVL